MKIRTKIPIIVFLLILITGIVAAVVSQTVAKNIAEQEVYNHLETTAESKKNHVQTFLKGEKELIKQLAESLVVKQLLLADKNDEDYTQKFNVALERFESTVWRAEYTYDIFVLDKDGIVVVSTEEEEIGKDKSDDYVFLCGLGDVFVKDAYVFEYKNLRTLAFSAPVRGERSAILGVAVARVSIKELDKITADRTGLGETGEIYIINKDGYMITPSWFIEDTFLKQQVDTENARRCFEEVGQLGTQGYEPEAILCQNYLGRDVLGVHAFIPEMSWCLLAEVSREEAFAPIAQLTRMMVMIIAALSVVGIILSVLLSRTITKPILALHHGTEEIMKGNLAYKVGTKAKDEIGQLSRVFDTMTADLKKSREELEEYSKGLEKMVEERTAELVKTNENLKQEIERRRKAEEEREALLEALKEINYKLEQSNKELQDFAYIASHDLREPLRKITSFGMLLQDSLQGKLDEDQQENFGFMTDGATRMMTMIDDLLTYSRVTTKAKPFEQVDLNKVIKDLKSLELATLLDDTKGTIHTPEPLLPVWGDSPQMHQLLQNLVGNGLKFRREGVPPQITIRSHEIDNNMVQVEVQDNGIGIPEEYHEQVFTMFKRLRSGESYKGSGIGLAVCKKIVNRHGGDIGIKSKLGEGTTFWFTLPSGNHSGNKQKRGEINNG